MMSIRIKNYSSVIAQWAAVVGVCGALFIEVSIAKESAASTVYLPMTFFTEAEKIETSACLEVEERVYPDDAWWRQTTSTSVESEQAFKKVISAIKSKNEEALYALSGAEQRSDRDGFNEQAQAFFEQFESVDIAAVPRSYQFDDTSVFFVRFRFKDRQFFVPMVFGYQEDGTYRFLPKRSQRVTYKLVRDWFMSSWGPSVAAEPMFCATETLEAATAQVSLSQTAQWHQSRLLLRGAPVDLPGKYANIVTRIMGLTEELKSALGTGSIDQAITKMTLEGGGRLKDWYVSASEEERQRYAQFIAEQEPFYFFDASPVFIVYTRNPVGVVQVMYWTRTNDDEYLWTNSSHITVADDVFKKGPLFDAASPFSCLRVP